MNASHYVDGIELYFWIRSKEESKSNYVTQWHTTLPFLRRNKLFLVLQFTLTHWARVTYVFVSKITSLFFNEKQNVLSERNILTRIFLSFPRLNDSRGFDAEKAGNGLPNVKSNGINGNGPLPPDGMYHVSDLNGTGGGATNNGMDLIHGSLTDKVNNCRLPPSTRV